MNSMIWNVRGVSNKITKQEVLYLRNSLKLNIFALVEQKKSLDQFHFCKSFKMEKVLANCSNHIWIFNDSSYEVEVIEDHEQFLHCRITSQQLNSPILWIVVYGRHTPKERRALWAALRRISVTDLPWSIGGDFNIIASTEERDGGARPNVNAINDFVECIMDCFLNYLGFEVILFTWQWRDTKQRLDRILFNHNWSDHFASTQIKHGVELSFDHRPRLIDFHINPECRIPQFRFQDMWLLHKDCLQNMKINW